MSRTRLVPLVLALLSACGGSATPPDTTVLVANVEEEDVPPDVRRTLVGVIRQQHTVRFPDGEGTMELEVAHGRATDNSDGTIRVPGDDAVLYLRSITVVVKDAAGYEIDAQLMGNPTNQGTAERPVHTRLVQITRTRSGLTGTSTSTMTVQVTPTEVEVL